MATMAALLRARPLAPRTLLARTLRTCATLPAAHADAFSSVPYAGNPACVVLLPADASFPADEWMQKVANEMNLSETSFLVPHGCGTSFDLRWFTPTEEVDLCGHATLASAHVLWDVHECEGDELSFETRSGVLIASRDASGWIALDLPTNAPTPVAADDADRQQLLRAFPSLGNEDELLYVGRNSIGGPGGGDMMVEVSPSAFAQLAYVPSEAKKIACRVLSVTAVGCPADPEPGRAKSDYAFSSRGFAPCVGVDEDPVCGSAHTMLGPYWQQKLGGRSQAEAEAEAEPMLARVASQRGGDVRVDVRGERTVLGGQAVTTLRSELLHCPPGAA